MAKYTSTSKPVSAHLMFNMSTPTYGPAGNFTVHSVATIQSSPAAVLSLIRDTSSWCRWNNFTPFVSPIKPTSPKASGDPTRGGDFSADSDIEAIVQSSDPALQTGKEGWLEKGTACMMHVYMKGDGLEKPTKKEDRKQGLLVTTLEAMPSTSDPSTKKGYRIAWRATGFSEWQLWSERVFEITETDDGKTQVVCWETFGGLLALAVKWSVGKQLVERFGDYLAGLKGEAEKKGEDESLRDAGAEVEVDGKKTTGV